MDPEKAAAIGIKAFLMKPIAASDLAAAVRRVLDETGTDSKNESI